MKTLPLVLALLAGAACQPTVGALSDPPDQDLPPDTSADTDTQGSDTGADPDTGADTDTGETEAPALVDYGAAGGFTVSRTEQEVAGGDCTTTADLYTPRGGVEGVVVVVAHGFVRSRESVAGWGAHYASWGLTALVPDLCHSSVFDTDHERNAEEMIQMAAALGAERVVYVGQSAGGLSAVLAAASDPRAAGAVGLDATDVDGLGVEAAGQAASAGRRLYGLVGEPSSCNADNNGLSAYGAAGARVLRLAGADHCDFESETDWLCTSFCLNDEEAASTEEEIQAAVRALSTAAVVELAGAGQAAGWWVAGGEGYDALAASGLVVEVEVEAAR